jgi:hypothetical protein
MMRSPGFEVDIKPVSFWVHGTQGPLIDGELERAAAWSGTIVSGARRI